MTFNYSNILVYIVRCNETHDPLDMTGDTSDLAVFETYDQAEDFLFNYLENEYGPDYSTNGTLKEVEVVDLEEGGAKIYATKPDGGDIKLWIEDRVMVDYGSAAIS